MISKRDFLELGAALKRARILARTPNHREQWNADIKAIAHVCKASNSVFHLEHWIDYIHRKGPYYIVKGITNMRETFMQGIQDKRLISMIIKRADSEQLISRTVAPLDYGPRANNLSGPDYYHCWDTQKKHIISVQPIQVQSMSLLHRGFDPAAIVTWETAWIVPREW